RAALEAMGVRVTVVRLGVAGAAASLARVLVGDPRPLQVLLYARRRARVRVAQLVAGMDVVHAQLVRTLSYLPRARPPSVVLDLIDALSVNCARRAETEHGPVGRLAGWEAARLRRCEASLVRSGVPCLVVSEAERAALGDGGHVRVVPNGVDLEAFPYSE